MANFSTGHIMQGGQLSNRRVALIGSQKSTLVRLSSVSQAFELCVNSLWGEGIYLDPKVIIEAGYSRLPEVQLLYKCPILPP